MLKEHFIAGWGGYPLIGTADQIVEGLQTLSKTGVDGTFFRGRATRKECVGFKLRLCRL